MTADEPLIAKHALIMGPPATLAEPIALELARLGADVALTTATNEAEEAFSLRHVSRGVKALGRQSMNESVDMSIGTAVQVAMRQVAKELGGLDIVVIGPELRIDKPAERLTDADWSRLLNINLSGVFYACRSAYRELLEKGGQIIVLLPAAEESAGAGFAAARGGADALVASLQREWAASGVTVTSVSVAAPEETAAAVRNAVLP
jgi:NAD(P)-dependent dehydrogenase (short-subunit alcohol dehydrogenase family)